MNIRKMTIMALTIMCCTITNIFSMDLRRHIFQLDDGNFQIEDEGYRWRNNFNVSLGGAVIGNWFFRNAGLVFALHQTQSNGIHAALSNIVNNVVALHPNQGGNITHVASSAVTIVIRNPNNHQFEAYSEVVVDSAGGLPNAPAVSIPSTGQGQNPLTAHCNAITAAPLQLSMYYTATKVPTGSNTRTQLESIANNLIGAKIPLQGGDGHYSCCEGQIVSRLFDTNPPNGANPLFPQIINDLILEANQPVHHGGIPPIAQITDNHIVLVILHIHSRFDPCAKCSKVLSGLSRQMNMPANMRTGNMRALFATQNFAAIGNLLTNLSTGQARFLIEVSSNEPYRFNGVNGIGPVCSCAELGGVDGNLANQVNIPAPNAIDFDINGAIEINTSLSIPNNNRNWYFPHTFPPYVVYGRITYPGGAVVAPAMCPNAHPAFPVGMPNLPAIP